MKKVVISGSASLKKEMKKWIEYWNNQKGYFVLDYPIPIKEKDFQKDYPHIHENFFRNIEKADILFIANEKKNGISGYIGASVFGEISFGVIQKIVHRKKIEIILANPLSKKGVGYDELSLWLELGWIDGILKNKNDKYI